MQFLELDDFTDGEAPNSYKEDFNGRNDLESEFSRNERNGVVKLKTGRQLPRALQPKPFKIAPGMFDEKIRSQPVSPTSPFHPRNQPLSPDVSKIQKVSNQKASVAGDSFALQPSTNRRSSREFRATSYRSRSVIQESLFPLLREALKKDDDDCVLENFLRHMKLKPGADMQSGPLGPNAAEISKIPNSDDGQEFSEQGEQFTVTIPKSNSKSFGFVLGTMNRNGKNVIFIDKLLKDSEAQRFFREGDELLTINGISLADWRPSSVLDYIKRVHSGHSGHILTVEARRRRSRRRRRS